MKNKIIYIGKITRDQILVSNKKISREIELENSIGWVSNHKVHVSDKTYTRKPKHKKTYSFE